MVTMTATARPKVLRVIARLNVGGPARQALILHERLPSRGFDTRLVHGLVGRGEASLEDEIDVRGLETVRLPDLGRRIQPWSDLRAFAYLLRRMLAEQPDIVHTHTAKAGALGRLAALFYNRLRGRRHQCVVVHTFHGHVFHGYFGPVGNWAVRAIERALARATDCVVTISPRQRQDIVDRYRIAPGGRVAVVPLGLELDRFFQLGPVDCALRRELGFPDDAVLLGYVGRLVAIKDLVTTLEALTLALPRAPQLRLVLVGDGDQRVALEEHARRVGVEAHVRFVGWRSDLERIYAGVDAVVLSSRNEGTPVALVEAMASGRPTVATAVGGVADVVADGVTGLLVPSGNALQMALALVRLAESPDERARLGAAGRRAAAYYGYDHLLEALSSLYWKALVSKRGAAQFDVPIGPVEKRASEERPR
jgi:glycosyltransferase involved in cell wall biosynthesis